jgi:hypothetical protein
MPYKTFDYPLHSAVHVFPEGDAVRFGKGYSHASEPDRPIQRGFKLAFPGMVYVKNPYTGAWLRGADTRVDTAENAILTTLKRRSIWAMNDFYDEHMMFKKFEYTHYVFGLMVVRFAQVFEMPPAADGTRAIFDNIPTQPFEIRLIEQPE